jgi:hypothetical protein
MDSVRYAHPSAFCWVVCRERLTTAGLVSHVCTFLRDRHLETVLRFDIASWSAQLMTFSLQPFSFSDIAILPG